MTGEQLLQAIKALGRPDPERWTFEGMREHAALAKTWDEANPEKAREHRRLCDEFDAQVKLEEEQERARRHAARATRELEKVGAEEGDFKRALAAAANPQNTYAVEVTRTWLKTPQVWLLLAGERGTGKSTAAALAVRTESERGGTVAMRRVSEVTRLSAFAEGAAELKMLKGVALLALDDHGAEAVTGWGEGTLGELLDSRHQSMRKTIITTNLSPDQDLRTRLGERFIDRVREDGRVVMLKGKSLRKSA